MRAPSVIVAICAVYLAGCLSPPDPDSTDPDGGIDTNTPTDVAVPTDVSGDEGATADTGDDEDDQSPQLACETCSEDAIRCGTNEQGAAVRQRCVVEANCPQWATIETCVGDQQCDPSEGCVCGETPCVPGEPPDCSGDGVVVCLEIDGCPVQVDVGREQGCDVPTPPPNVPGCDEAPDTLWCTECDDNGRDCEETCPGDRGYTCGELPEL